MENREFENGLKYFFDTLEKMTGKRIPDGEAEVWRQVSNECLFPRDTIITHVGDVPDTYYFIVKGLTRQYYLDIEGQDITRGFSWEGEFVNTEVFIQDEVSDFTIETIEPCYMLSVKIPDWNRLKNTDYMKDVQIAALKRNVCRRLKRDAQFLMHGSVGRYTIFTHEYAHISSRIKQSYLASYLGMTPETLSRIRRSINENQHKNG